MVFSWFPDGFPMAVLWFSENHKKTMGKLEENKGKSIGQPSESHPITIREQQDKHWKTMGKPSLKTYQRHKKIIRQSGETHRQKSDENHGEIMGNKTNLM